MSYTKRSGYSLPSTWLELNVAALDLLLAATLLLGSASFFALEMGDPETMALIALVGITVALLGIAFVRLSEHLRTEGLPLP